MKYLSTFHQFVSSINHDKNQNVKLLPKLTKNHMEPNSFQKMSVKLAVQVLSNTVSCAIRTALKTMPSIFDNYMEHVIPTANIIERFNNIFDCLNCRNFLSKNPFEKPLRINNNKYIYLEHSLVFLKKLKILSKNENYFKFIKGLKLMISAQLALINHVNSTFNVEFILTGKTNQDALENFFSALRGKGGFNYMPSSYQIGVHFANIVVAKVLFHSIHSNCLPDDELNLMLNWKEFKDEYKKSIKHQDSQEIDTSEAIDLLPNTTTEFTQLTSNAIAYFAGYCVRAKIDCGKCIAKLLKPDTVINANEVYIHEKNFKKDSSKFGSLKAPTDEWFEMATFLVQIFENFFNKKSHVNNILEEMTKFSFEKLNSRFGSFMPNQNDLCYEHFHKLVYFLLLVLLRKNCKWLVVSKGERKSKTAASRKLKILSN